MTHNPPQTANFVDGPHGRLAIRHISGSGPGLIWLGGYASDMRGTKAEALLAHAAYKKIGCTMFDYSGTGESDGDFENGTISRWTQDTLTIIDNHTAGPLILVGSSMGAWIAGLVAKARPDRIAGMILIAPAPDFATELTPHQWPADRMKKLMAEGRIEIPSEYDDTVMVYTRALFDDGAQQRVLNAPLAVHGPVRILQGMKDDVVPWQHAVRYAEHIDSPDVHISLTKDGDHRMSGDAELRLLLQAVDDLTRSE